jgi:cation diffusion facilitator CzcD-associated flavoprotein CzcO
MKICIIGGGLSGTIACKYAVEKGHKPTILEKTNSTGGVYSLIYDKKNYKLSSSKYITSFSDHYLVIIYPPRKIIFGCQLMNSKITLIVI